MTCAIFASWSRPKISVATKPGCIAFAVTPVPSRRRARAHVSIRFAWLSTAWLVRASEDLPSHRAWQALFLLCLILVGGCVIACLPLRAGWWLMSGTTLAVMILIATCDFSHTRQAAVR